MTDRPSITGHNTRSSSPAPGSGARFVRASSSSELLASAGAPRQSRSFLPPGQERTEAPRRQLASAEPPRSPPMSSEAGQFESNAAPAKPSLVSRLRDSRRSSASSIGPAMPPVTPAPVPPSRTPTVRDAQDDARPHKAKQTPAVPSAPPASPKDEDVHARPSQLAPVPVASRAIDASVAPQKNPTSPADLAVVSPEKAAATHLTAGRSAARATCLGAAVATGWIMAAASGAARALLPLGAPTAWCSGAAAAALLLSLVPQSASWRTPLKLTLTGAFLAVQLAAFATTPLPLIVGTCALGVTLGLLPALLQSLPGQACYRRGEALGNKVQRVRDRMGPALFVPIVSMMSLHLLNAWTFAMPALYAAALFCQSLHLHGQATSVVDTLRDDNLKRAKAGPPPKPTGRLASVRGPYRRARQFAGQAAAAASDLSMQVGLIGVTASCVAGAPWRYWLKTTGQGARQLPNVLWQNSNNVAHESAPLAARATLGAASYAA